MSTISLDTTSSGRTSSRQSTSTGSGVTVAPTASSSVPFPTYSSFSDPLATATSSAGGDSSSNTSTDPSQIQSSASLYLYTFLATLVLLLGVSAAIVMRSLILRRRHRRMIEEAIRNGTWIAPTTPYGRRIDPGKRPIMHEVFVGEEKGIAAARLHDKEHLEWEAIMPVSVSQTPVQGYASPTSPSASSPSLGLSGLSPPISPFTTQPPPPRALHHRIASTLSSFASLFHLRPRSTAPAPLPLTPLTPHQIQNQNQNQNQPQTSGLGPNSMPPPLALQHTPGAAPLVNVAVLIAMPSQHHQLQERSSEEDGLPLIELGLAEVGVEGAEEWGGEVQRMHGGMGKRVGSEEDMH